MQTIFSFLNHRLSNESFDTRLGQQVCYLVGIAIVPVSIVALVRHPGSRTEFLFGLGLAGSLGLLCMRLGTLCLRSAGWRDKVALRSRWPEFASYVVCVGFLILGLMSLSTLGLSPAGVTLGVLLVCSLSLAVLVLGMRTTLVRAINDEVHSGRPTHSQPASGHENL